MHLRFTYILIAIICICVKTEIGVFGKLDTSLTTEEVQALRELKSQILKYLTNDYMKDDHYLVRFLRAKKLNVEDAKEMILRSLAWRKKNKMDTVLQETLEVEKFFPYLITHDREGRPVGTARAVDFQFRRYLVAGRYNEIVRLVYKIAEIAMKEIRLSAQTTGKNITQGIIIGDLSGFSQREHACLLCIRMYLDLIGQYERNYPQIASNFIAVNTPAIFQTVWEIIKPALSEYTKNTVALYGYDRQEWRKVITELIADNQLPVYLGGTYHSESNRKNSHKN